MLKRKTIIENINDLTAQQIIEKIENQCSESSIDKDNCSIEVVDGNLEISSNEEYWPDEY